MIETYYYGYLGINLWEIAVLPFFIILIFVVSTIVKRNGLVHNPAYKYYTFGLWAKMMGATVFCLIYLFYYKGGDTLAYYESGLSFVNLFQQSPEQFFKVLMSHPSVEMHSLFSTYTGYPLSYLYYDNQTLIVIKLTSILLIATFKSYLLSTLLLAWISYLSIWKTYLLFCRYYPKLIFQLSIGFLFLPSVIFWGSGILKDTFTFAATCWFVISFHNIFIIRKKIFWNIMILMLATFVLIEIKPYILIALVPCAINWWLLKILTKIKSQLIVLIAIPVIYSVAILIIAVLFAQFGSSFGDYSPDKIINKAIITQTDLKSEHYHGSSFDIGTIDPTLMGVIKLAPAAINASFYRPYLWESSNFVILIAALESTGFLILSIMCLWYIKFVRFKLVFRVFFNNPIVAFAFFFAVLFAFSIGLTTANFGALVRFKIPFLPFFVSSLFILIYHFKYSILKAEGG